MDDDLCVLCHSAGAGPHEDNAAAAAGAPHQLAGVGHFNLCALLMLLLLLLLLMPL